MTNEERDLITRFIERVAGAPGALPAGAPPLPPIDREADALIVQLFEKYPEARYRITQLAFVTEHALVEAQNRINRLQVEVQQARQAAQQAPAQPGGSPWGAAAGAAGGAAAAQPQQSRGFFSSLFGGSSAPPPPPPPQYAAPPPAQYPPGYNPGMFPQQGTGFLGSALRTATGVAGGVLAAEALTSLFSGRGGLGGGFGGGWGGGPERVVEVVDPSVSQSPWGGTSSGADPYDVGGAAQDPVESDKFSGPAQVDQSAWTPAPGQGGGWQDAAQDTGWQDASNQQDTGWQDASDQGGGWDSGSDNTQDV
jgi:hypothetical protein